MFASFKVIHEGLIINVTLNVTHITSLENIDPRNPDSGTLINLRDGRAWESPTPLFESVNYCDGIIKRFGNQILVSYIAEQMPIPRKKPRKKTTVKTVKKS